MPLTPQDVHDKLFTSVRFAKGYDEDEVDAFLDEVEAELRRLLTENEDLRARLADGRAGAPEAGGPSALPVPAAVPAAAPATTDTEDMLRRTLLLAQRTADEAVSEARQEAARIVAEAQDRASGMERDVAAQRAAALRDLEAQRDALQGQVEQLRGFEREYRTRLRAHLELALHELDQASRLAPGGELPFPPGAGPGPERDEEFAGRFEPAGPAISGPPASPPSMPPLVAPAADVDDLDG